ncbi:proline--tRNA ligase [Paenibacillus herberti]|uniref:Proline--tRNA ligase n=1 Tax=Paenibacillus herberti TaxID=1619309 RepID=A0A229NU47_9BACL|nr:proline--tRNA ligase [Paenibacillus herberti]OXM13401.1 proline--tRNA ligase [Paenibacillus herberti]
MRQSKMLLPTLRETPSEAEAASHALMLRAGYIRQLAAGVYTYLPLGRRVLRKAEELIRQEMDRTGAQEMFMPALQPVELLQQSGRYAVYGPELMRLLDRHEREFALGPTHEEVITALVGGEINSYRKLPLTLYQIQTKFRDERRPRFGLLRGREFLMKDAYSFDADWAGVDVSYQKMLQAYHRIFSRIGLRYRAVEADPGAIGGEGGTHEFIALADIGEDTIATCECCGYAANLEKAEGRMAEQETSRIESEAQTQTQAQAQFQSQSQSESQSESQSQSKSSTKAADHSKAPSKLHTPDVRTIAELTAFLNLPATSILKTVLFTAGGKPVAVVVRGDHEINEIKVLERMRQEGFAEADDAITLADPDTVLRVTGALPGFAGPVGIAAPLLVDREAATLSFAFTGAGEEHFHLLDVVPGRDFPLSLVGDFRNVAEGDGCPRCAEGRLTMSKGIEIGHVFKLGTKYSEKLGAACLDASGKEQLFLMGCYGIGVSRVLAASAEQFHDEQGLAWPIALAPFHVHLIPISPKDAEQQQLTEQLYERFAALGVEVLLDDRDERPGVKFKDADLIGIPVRIIVGREAGNGIVEYAERSSISQKETLPVAEAVERVVAMLELMRIESN